MLTLLFNQDTEAPLLPDLHVQDSESLTHIPVGGVEGWDNDFLQTLTLTYAPMAFDTELLSKSALFETNPYWCRRLSKTILRVSFSTSGANSVIRIIYTDNAGIKSYGENRTITALSYLDGSNYLAPLEFFDLYGANKVSFIVESISAGTINLSFSGV